MEPRRYRITVRGRLSDRFASAFEGMTLEGEAGRTIIEGWLVDAAALYGLIERLRDFGLELESMQEVSP